MLFVVVGVLALGSAALVAKMLWFKGEPDPAAPPPPPRPVAKSQTNPDPAEAVADENGVGNPQSPQKPPTTAGTGAGTVGLENVGSPPSAAGEQAPTTAETKAPPIASAPKVGEGKEGAKLALDAFFAASSADERKRYVQAPQAVSAQMDKYYEKHPIELQISSVEYKLSSKAPGSDKDFHIFQVTTDAQPQGFPVSVEETDSGYKVDWVAFVQFHDNMLGKFIKIPQLDPKTFHAIVERRHYFRTDVPDLGSKICFGIQPPIPGFEGYAFVDKDSELGKIADQKFQWDHMYFPVVKLQWKQEQDGSQHIELIEIVKDNWRALD